MQSLITNSIICGDCRDKMRQYIPDESVDLIYLDPPFFSGKDYDLIWDGDNKNTVRSFGDTKFYKKVCECGSDFPEGYLFCPQCGAAADKAKDVRMNDIDAYVGWLKVRLQECHRVLKPTGSIYVHLDWHAVHYIKVAMDRIFGMKNFQNEIIWHYFAGGKAKRFFARKHDNILAYTKGKTHTFNPMKHKRRLDFKPSLKNDAKNADTGKDEFGYYSTVTMDDVWDIKSVFNMSNEYEGYPTQKPQALLERIIKASSNVGDLILDPFCGCGTALAVAQKLGRRYIGIDIEMPACAVMQERLEKQGSTAEVIDATELMTEGKLRELHPALFQKWAVRAVQGTMSVRLSADGGIDGHTFSGDPIQVKRSDSVGVKVLREFQTVIQDDDRKGGIIIAFSFTKGAKDKAKDAKAKYGINIELKTVKELLQ